MSNITELRVHLLRDIYEYYLATGDAKSIQLDKSRGKLTLAYQYLNKRSFIDLKLSDDSQSGIASITPEAIAFLVQTKIQGYLPSIISQEGPIQLASL